MPANYAPLAVLALVFAFAALEAWTAHRLQMSDHERLRHLLWMIAALLAYLAIQGNIHITVQTSPTPTPAPAHDREVSSQPLPKP